MAKILTLTAGLTLGVVAGLAWWPTSGDRITALRATEPALIHAPYAQMMTTTGIVTGSRVNLRSGPSQSYGIHYTLPYGAVVEVISQPSQDWVELRDVSTGQTGFMASDYIQHDQRLNG